MSFGIIVRKNSESMRFRPHFNQALGYFVHTKEDYLRGIKEHGLIPQKEARKIAEEKRRDLNKKYKTSQWAHDMVGAIKRSNGKPGSAFYNELEKKRYDTSKRKQMIQAQSRIKTLAEGLSRNGGFF